MPLSPGDKLGPYEVLALIGKGGMGEVWKARDMRLDRIVAIKTSSAAFGERFEREARVVAALNHPHICTLYDVGPDYLVMELIEGAEIKGPLPLATALQYAIQLGGAVDAAHRKSIVHRDLKPANILVTKSGIKVLDFGLAKIEQTAPLAETDASLTRALTQQGAIVGTLQYMAPEQLQGQQADFRADIFSFGCVLYELLTGKRAFDGANAASVIAAIMERPSPSVAEVAPGSLDWVLRLCLAKDPDQRWQSMRDVRAALERVAESAELSRPAPARASRAPWIAAAVCALAAIAAAVLYLRGAGVSPSELRLDIATPPTVSPASMALSPDGRRIAYVATVDGVSRLWMRALDSTTANPVPGSEGSLHPFWSPDSRSIGFLAGLDLKRVDLGGGEPRVIARVAPLEARASWSGNNAVLFVHTVLVRSDLSSKAPVPVTKLASGQTAHRAPHFFPGGKEFLYLANGPDAGLWRSSLDGAPPRRIAAISPDNDSAAEYLAPNWLFRVHRNSLVAQRFDLGSNTLAGEPVILVSGVGVDPNSQAGDFSVSASGAIAWRAGESSRHQLVWLDRAGRNLDALGAPDPLVLNPEISPDGERVAVTRGRLDSGDIWIQDGGRSTRFTTDPADDRIGIWSPDGKEIVFASFRTGKADLYRKPSSGMANEEVLLHSDFVKFPCSWSPDGRFILYFNNENNGDLMVLPLTGDRKPYPFSATPFSEGEGVFSPDGKWVAYTSNEWGRNEIYVRPFPGPGAAYAVSASGGSSPRWRRDGKELYFLSPDSKLMATRVEMRSAAFATGTPQALFTVHPVFAPGKQQYDVARDGRFLVVIELGTTEPIHILLNWNRPQ